MYLQRPVNSEAIRKVFCSLAARHLNDHLLLHRRPKMTVKKRGENDKSIRAIMDVIQRDHVTVEGNRGTVEAADCGWNVGVASVVRIEGETTCNEIDELITRRVHVILISDGRSGDQKHG